MHRCIALSCLLVKALSVYLKVYFLSIVHILCKFNRFSRGGRIFSVFGCNYFFILGDFRYDEFLINPFLFPSQTIHFHHEPNSDFQTFLKSDLFPCTAHRSLPVHDLLPERNLISDVILQFFYNHAKNNSVINTVPQCGKT